MNTPSEYFGLFLTALRNGGTPIPMSDKAVAVLIKDALEVVSPNFEQAAEVAEAIALDLEALIEGGYLCSDNGTDGNGGDDSDDED